MAITVEFDGVRLHDMGDSDGTTGISAFSGAAPGSEPDFKYQGSNAISKKVGTSQNGIQVDTSGLTPANVDMTLADRQLWFIKMQATNKDALDVLGTPSGVIRAGSASSAYNELEIISGDAVFYPIVGGFNLQCWNPDVTELRDSQTGSPAFNATDYFAFGCDFSATSRAENVILDAIDLGRGLCLTGNTPDGEFTDFLAFDEGDPTNGRFGCFASKEGIFYVLGRHWIGRNAAGTTVATTFNDPVPKTIVFPNSFHNAGDCGFDIDLNNASTAVTLSRHTFIGRGTGDRIRFNTETDVVGGTTDEIQVQAMIDTFRPGEAVIARSQGGTETPGLTNGTTYYVGNNQTTTATGITLHTTKADAMNASGGLTNTPVNLTASSAGNGEIWRIDKQIDTRPDFEVDATFNASATLDLIAGRIVNHRNVTLRNIAEIDGTTIRACKLLSLNGALLTNALVSQQDTLEGESFCVCDDLDDITGTSFDNTGGRGHAIQSTENANSTLSNVDFTGYGGSTTIANHEFDNTSGVASNQITMDAGDVLQTGDPVFYSKVLTANTVVTGLTDETVYFVRRVSAGVVTLHVNEGDALNNNAVIGLTAGTGNETHRLYSANAAIKFTGTDGSRTVTVSGGSTPTYAAETGIAVTISSNVVVTFTGMRDNTEVRIYQAGTSTELDGVENASGGTPDNRSFAASVAAATSVDYVIHSEQYEYIRVEGFTWPSVAQSIAVKQRFDRNYSNP